MARRPRERSLRDASELPDSRGAPCVEANSACRPGRYDLGPSAERMPPARRCGRAPPPQTLTGSGIRGSASASMLIRVFVSTMLLVAPACDPVHGRAVLGAARELELVMVVPSATGLAGSADGVPRARDRRTHRDERT